MIPILCWLLAAAPTPWAFSTTSLAKVRPGEDLEPQSAIALELGRGECQAAQLVVTAGSPVFELRASAPPLAGQGGVTLAVNLSREVDLELQHPSNLEGRVGPWPDVLIPAVDPVAHEARRAFPYDAPGDVPVAIYLEVCAPASALPGIYRGAVQLEARDRPSISIPVTATLLHYTLPATSSLPNAFGFSGILAAKAHGLDSGEPDAMLALTQRYATLALMNRISLFGMTMEPPPLHRGPHGVELDFRDYDRELAPFLDGTALPSGARFTSLELRSPARLSDDTRLEYDRAMVAHLAQRGWLDRLFFYAPDEPKPEAFAEVRRQAELAHRADPRIRVLLTASRQPGLEGVADLWTPNMVCTFSRPGARLCPSTASPAAYTTERARGAKLWWYQSCMSHSCGPAQGAAAKSYAGWPTYVIDVPAVLNRAMGVAAYRFGIEGELYYSTIEAYDGDPWQSVWRFDGNGDGTLFYPGTPARIGGKTDVPLASLRLKLVRDGLQDYELLKLAEKLGLHDLAQRAASALVPHAWEIERDPAVWNRWRRTLAEAVDAQVRKPRARASR